MALGSIIGIIFLIGIAGCGYYVFQSYTKKRKKKVTLGLVFAALLALLMVGIAPSFHTVEAGQVAVRRRDKGDLGAVSADEFIATVVKEIEEKIAF